MCGLRAHRLRANWKWEGSFNLTLCHAPKSSSSLCTFLNLFGSSAAYPSALFRSQFPAFVMARRSAPPRGWATINEWLFFFLPPIRCSRRGFLLQLIASPKRNHNRRCRISVTGRRGTKGGLAREDLKTLLERCVCVCVFYFLRIDDLSVL